MPQLVIIADRVMLSRPDDAPEGAPVMGGFEYAEPGPGVDYAVNVHDVYVDDLGSFANVSVIYSIPDGVQVMDPEAEGTDEADNVIQFPTAPDDEKEDPAE